MDEKANASTNLKLGVCTGIFLAASFASTTAYADCTQLIDKHLEYYDGIKDHLANRTTFDPSIKKIPYDAKIIDNNVQQYPLLSRNESFFYPNTAARSVDLGFHGSLDDESGYIHAICIIQTPDEMKWVVWQDEIRVWFYAEIENPDR